MKQIIWVKDEQYSSELKYTVIQLQWVQTAGYYQQNTMNYI